MSLTKDVGHVNDSVLLDLWDGTPTLNALRNLESGSNGIGFVLDVQLPQKFLPQTSRRSVQGGAICS